MNPIATGRSVAQRHQTVSQMSGRTSNMTTNVKMFNYGTTNSNGETFSMRGHLQELEVILIVDNGYIG